MLGVVRGYLVAGGEPYSVVASDVVQRLLQIFVPEWCVDDERVQAERHDTARRAAFLIKLIELINNGLIESFAGQALANEHADVVELDRIGNRDHALDVERKGLVVCAPVEQIGESKLAQQAWRLECLS